MIILEYSYIQILLPLIVEGEFWKRMPNYKESLKIFVSILHNLFIESFQNLPSAQQDIIPDDVYFLVSQKKELGSIVRFQQKPNRWILLIDKLQASQIFLQQRWGCFGIIQQS
ncbi:unnamed protein product (macronuclear) [Paramecium tetraurelia]|uniref:Uncharacterized protein n=1 Tax=Paramecium tetraurelia TaxID=5888 RepID=A0EHF1_PARTE|nr:uncharacterized protein GSPATT00027066001 [Paramecium tetraurelia]CAK94742.1 unnamed protein product [Paramecium tetraurelia]|eukprot:XP_001462115.1 hypothetical protein (macronuclear) [Paramecium tetraurelia strain d4-2]